MVGLKTLLPELADILGVSRHALYERQRALTHLGLLKASGGRGPGSGVRADAEAIAMVLIALLVTENLSDTDERVAMMAKAKVVKSPCLFTGEKTLLDALIKVLSVRELNAEMRAEFVSVEVLRDIGARINFRTRLGMDSTYFQLKKTAQRPAVISSTAKMEFSHLVSFEKLLLLIGRAGER